MKRKPRRHERFAIYKKMLKTFEQDLYYSWTAGFCRELMYINIKLKRSEEIEDYPELLKYNPEHKLLGSYWWPVTSTSKGREIRMKVLREIIKEMSK